MGKKRKAPAARPVEAKQFDPEDAKIGPIRTFEDVADSEDEFHLNRNKIMLKDGPDAKRRKHFEEEDAFLEPSDEEILQYSDSDESEDYDDDDDREDQNQSKSKSKHSKKVTESDPEDEDEDGWGASKRDYYGADQPQTEEAAQEEAEEATRLRLKRLEKMSETDFGFDEDDWLDSKENDTDADVVKEVLNDRAITEETTPEERLEILRLKYPEFEFLANELSLLQPLLKNLSEEVKSTPSRVSIMKLRCLSGYVSALMMYFAIFTSPARSSNSVTSSIKPAELRDHSVMSSILKSRELWTKVKDISIARVEPTPSDDIILSEDSVQTEVPKTIKPVAAKKSRKQIFREAAAAEAARSKSARIQTTEADLADLSALIPKTASRRKSQKTPAAKTSAAEAESDSDFGEETHLDARTAAEKAQKRKSLRFYTSEITQKSNKRAGAGRDAGGDADLPYRERLRDRQERLNAEAEKRGKKLDSYGRGSALGGDESGEDDDDDDAKGGADLGMGNEEDDDEYYDLIARTASSKKTAKKDAAAAILAQAKADGLLRVVEGEVGADGKRAIGYVIQKNKGLAPKRKKEVRNPRVKKRNKYEEKMKKLSSVRAVYKGGEGRGGYGGEMTGIKTGVVKSVKL